MRTILVPLSRGPNDRRAIQHAIRVAGPLNAHVTVLLPGGPLSELVPAERDAAAWPNRKLLQEARALLARQADAARRVVEEVVSETGAALIDAPGSVVGATVSFQARDGLEADVILEAAPVNDLILFHRDVEGLDAGLDPSPTVKSALQSAGRPLLILPTRLPVPFATVAIGWNGSLEGAHAVTGAMPFLARATAVHILTAATTKTDVEQGARLRRYLGWYGIEAPVHPLNPGGASVGALLLAKAAELGADLLVVGGYSHSRLRQTIFGGVTHHLLRHAVVPVLLSR